MPFLFYVAIFFFVVAVLAALGAAVVSDKRRPARAAVAFLAFGLILCLLASMNTVPVRYVGIVTSFGKPTGETTGAGLQFVAPWENVDDWDASRQAYDHRSEKTCVQVRIASLANACVEALVEWHTRPGRAPEQWASYKKEFETFTARRVDPAFAEAFNEAFNPHDPLKNIDGQGNLNVPLGPYADTVKAGIVKRIGEDVEVLSVVVTRVNYDDKTQGYIEAFQQAVLKTRTLEKEKANALIQKQITETNAQVNDVTRCLEIADRHGNEPGFCLGGGNPVQSGKK
ncbi:SPFH domain-containing protein [Micromonospora lupini]|uniref:SPFH domain-containing protein n=1 Tax=Micromonospora lupini TaxID=285679 RepID=UPI00225A8CF5|nr:SPFH domain-containing protein [Micromonospora lupini]MCX5066612.1 SPFH domain-containing protein [Micromonospora lupini]